MVAISSCPYDAVCVEPALWSQGLSLNESNELEPFVCHHLHLHLLNLILCPRILTSSSGGICSNCRSALDHPRRRTYPAGSDIQLPSSTNSSLVHNYSRIYHPVQIQHHHFHSRQYFVSVETIPLTRLHQLKLFWTGHSLCSFLYELSP